MEIEASINEIDKKIAESQRNEEVYELRKKRTALEHFRLENLPFAERRKEIKSLISDVVEKRIGSIRSETATVFYQSFLYAEVLLHYYLMGAPKSKDRLLCIDEGQDISQLQYLLLYRINGDAVCFNIYGDINQKMQQTCGVDQWNSLQKFIKEVPGTVNRKDVSLFHLSENYRNSEEVVSFYNTAGY